MKILQNITIGLMLGFVFFFAYASKNFHTITVEMPDNLPGLWVNVFYQFNGPICSNVARIPVLQNYYVANDVNGQDGNPLKINLDNLTDFNAQNCTGMSVMVESTDGKYHGKDNLQLVAERNKYTTLNTSSQIKLQ